MAGRKSTAIENRNPLSEKVRPAVQKALGKRIAAWRRSKGLSQEAFADICRIHRSHMGQVERGESNLTLGTLVTITAKLERTLSELFKGIA